MTTEAESVSAKILAAIYARYPLLYIATWEEERLEQVLKQVSRVVYKDDRPVILWSTARGFYNRDGPVANIKQASEALQYIKDTENEAIYLLKDLPAFFPDDKTLVRGVRDLYYELANTRKYVLFSYPTIQIPEEAKKEVFVIELNMPTEADIYDYLSRALNTNSAHPLGEDWLHACAAAMRGLAFNEIRHLILRLSRDQSLDLERALTAIHEEKAQVLKKESCLKVMTGDFSLENIGGLEVLKKWVMNRKTLFTRDAFASGVPLPSGILLMGVSGCGKSMAAKVIASAWDLPLVRLDMNLVMSGSFGSPEYAFDRAAKVAESIAPVVLWIDEVENSFGYDEGPQSGGNVNIFSSFLTWMQEKPQSVFIAATANRIERLPAEMIRKGRFDEVFFLDLPSEPERLEIFKIHITRNGGNPEEFNLKALSIITKEWSGAEIEQAVNAARVDAYAESRAFNSRDVSRNVARMVPLSRTMYEQVKQLRQWSQSRATLASKKADRIIADTDNGEEQATA